uniref:G-protein coupled receptors family 1 profile domain-containing protein n=1 Tax=Periophthalmus magnuspinnatus TaxID=409849 RepID=A0A3B3ZNL1_9GOBI
QSECFKPVQDDSLVSNDFSTTLGALILGFVFLVGVPGNLFIVWSILARIRRHSVTTFLILNLACADGFLMALTLFFVIYLAKQSWVFGIVMCKGVFYLCNTNMYASIFLITLMSLHRLVAVLLPTKVSLIASPRIAKRVVVGMWALVFIISIPSLGAATPLWTHGCGVSVSCDVCAFQVRFQYAFETVSGFILPYAVIITSYVLILRRLRQTQFRKKVRSEKLILAIVVTFGIFWLPYHVINMIQVWRVVYPPPAGTRARAVTSALAFISSCANPVLYTFAGKSYIRQNGFAFMARLLEGTSLDQGTKKGRSPNSESNVGLNNVVSNGNGGVSTPNEDNTG